MKRTISIGLGVLTAGAIAVLLAGCGDDETTAPENPWTGTYTSATKFGGATGTWVAFQDMEVTPTGEVVLGGVTIKNPTFTGNSLSWAIADGNAGDANVTFKTSSESSYYWENPPVGGKLFEGSYQNPGEGPLDFRGIVQ